MGIKQFFIALISFIIFPTIIFASSTPSLSSPSNNTIVSSSALSWSAVEGATSYRVQVDDQNDFASPNKDYNTTNTTYSPNLSEGTWYWRVKAKDSSNNWGDWSENWSFTLTSATATPTPAPTENPSPSASANPTASPSPTPSHTAAPVGDASTEKFTISNLPTTVHHDQSFTINVQLQSLTPNSKYYLKGAFVKDGSTNYFGLTKVGNNWISNNLTYSSQFDLTTDSSGNWSGQLTLQADAVDSGFTGTGTYLFKIGRYNASGSGPTWSTTANITIDTEPANPTSSPSPSPTASASTSPLSSTTYRSTTTPTSIATNEPEISLPNLESSQTATVAGIQLVQANKTLSPILDSAWYIIGGVVLLLLGASPTIYLFLKPRITDAIHYLKSQRD